MTEIPELIDPEAAAEADVVIRAAPQVGMIAILAVALGMILAVDAVCRAFFGTLKGAVGWIPFAGNVVTSPISKIEQKVISYLSGLEQDIDSAMGHAVHNLATLINQLWHALEESTVMAALWPQYLVQAIWSIGLKSAVRWIKKELRVLERKVQHAGTRVIKIEKTVTRVVIRTTVKNSKRITVAVPKYVHRELLEIRHEARHAAKLANIAIRKAESSLVPQSAKTWPEAVAMALPALGLAIPKLALDAIKCTQFQNLFKNRGCSLWKDLEDILGLLADALIFDAMCHVLPLLNKAFEDIATPFVRALVDATKKLCPGPPASWTEFSVHPNRDRPAQTLGPTPS